MKPPTRNIPEDKIDAMPAALPEDPASASSEPGPLPDNGGAVEASPEEQAAYERFVAQGVLLLYGEETMPKLVAQMRQIKEPREALATVAHLVFQRVRAAADEAGVELPGDVIFPAGQEIFEHAADLATMAGIHDFKQDKEAFEGAWYLALDKVRMDGGFDEGEVAQDMEALAEAERSGGLDDLLGVDLSGAGPKPQMDEAQPAPQGFGAGMGA